MKTLTTLGIGVAVGAIITAAVTVKADVLSPMATKLSKSTFQVSQTITRKLDMNMLQRQRDDMQKMCDQRLAALDEQLGVGESVGASVVDTTMKPVIINPIIKK